MSMETTTSAAASLGAPARRSLGGLIAISFFWFAISFIWAALQNIIIPSQINGMLFQQATQSTNQGRVDFVAANSPLTIALVEAPGLIVALIGNPLFGLLSDRTPGRFGRRRPYVVLGSLANVVGLAVMAFGPNLFLQERSGQALSVSMIVLMLGLMLTQAANNAAAAPFHALLPDLVPAEQRGTASGIMGIALFLGQIGGFIVPSLTGFSGDNLDNGTQTYSAYSSGIALAYLIVAAVIVVMALLTAVTVHEKPWQRPVSGADAAMRHLWRDLVLTVVVTVVVVGILLAVLNAGVGPGLNQNSVGVVQLVAVIVAGIGAARAFGFSPTKTPDFSWVVLTRMLVMMGIYIVQFFMLDYMQFVVHAPVPSSATIFFVLVTVTALISTVFAGYFSDRFGRKRMVYISGAFMAVVGAAFVVAPVLVPGNLLAVAYGAATIFGLGYGAYISVDWALVADVLPDESTYARDMGVWNIGLTLPQVLATVLGAWLIGLGTALVTQQFGYTLLFVWFVVFCLLGTVTVRFIKGVKR